MLKYYQGNCLFMLLKWKRFYITGGLYLEQEHNKQ